MSQDTPDTPTSAGSDDTATTTPAPDAAATAPAPATKPVRKPRAKPAAAAAAVTDPLASGPAPAEPASAAPVAPAPVAPAPAPAVTAPVVEPASAPAVAQVAAYVSTSSPLPFELAEAEDDLDASAFETLTVVSSSAGLPARLGAEAFGSFLLVLVGLGVLLYTNLSGAGALGVALGFGLAVVGGTIALGHISGGHFNPAVTLGAAIAGRMAWRDVVPYWLAQILGGALAAATLYLTVPSGLPALVQSVEAPTTTTFFALTANGYGASSPLSTLSTAQVTFGLAPALLIEALATAALVGVVLGATSRRVARTVAPFAIGLTYAVLLLVASPITGGGLNPARSTAAAVFSGGDALGQLWLFWVAPLVGAALAAGIYRAFGTEPDEDNLLADPEPVLVGHDPLAVNRTI